MSDYDYSKGITVCVGNWGYYAEGELRDQWITLPKTDEEIQAFLVDNGLYDEDHEEIYISDYDEYPFGLSYGEALSEYSQLGDLNLLAKQLIMIDAMDASDGYDRIAALEHQIHCIENPINVLELMNVVQQAHEIPYYPYDSDLENVESCDAKFGYTQANATGLISELEKFGAASYFDYERYGESLSQDFTLGDTGYIDNHLSGPDYSRFTRDEIRMEVEQLWTTFQQGREHTSEPSKAVSLTEKCEEILSVAPSKEPATPELTDHSDKDER